MTEVAMTRIDVSFALAIARERDRFSREAGYSDRYGYRGPGMPVDIVGALGEIAFAKFLNRYPDTTSAVCRTGDVGRWEVRATARLDGCLIVYAGDHDDRRYVLVTGLPPVMRVIGWIYGREAKRAEFWKASARHPAYFVRQVALCDGFEVGE